MTCEQMTSEIQVEYKTFDGYEGRRRFNDYGAAVTWADTVFSEGGARHIALFRKPTRSEPSQEVTPDREWSL